MCDQGERREKFLVNSSQCFWNAERSTDDSYIIAQMVVGGFHKLGPRYGAPLIGSLSVFHSSSVTPYLGSVLASKRD